MIFYKNNTEVRLIYSLVFYKIHTNIHINTEKFKNSPLSNSCQWKNIFKIVKIFRDKEKILIIFESIKNRNS